MSLLSLLPRRLVLAFMLCAALGARAEVDPATAETLLRQSGLWEQLAGIGPQARAGMIQSLAQEDPAPSAAEQERLGRVMEQAFEAGGLRATSVSRVARDLDRQQVTELRRWFESPLGRSVAELEARSSAGVDPETLMREGSELYMGLPAERQQLLQDLLQASDAAEALTRIAINSALAGYRGASLARPEAPRLPESELRALLESQRPQMLQAHAAYFIASAARAYASLPTPQLRDYVGFLRSRAGQHFNQVCLDAVDAALVQATVEMGRRLPSALDDSNI